MSLDLFNGRFEHLYVDLDENYRALIENAVSSALPEPQDIECSACGRLMRVVPHPRWKTVPRVCYVCRAIEEFDAHGTAPQRVRLDFQTVERFVCVYDALPAEWHVALPRMRAVDANAYKIDFRGSDLIVTGEPSVWRGSFLGWCATHAPKEGIPYVVERVRTVWAVRRLWTDEKKYALGRLALEDLEFLRDESSTPQDWKARSDVDVNGIRASTAVETHEYFKFASIGRQFEAAKAEHVLSHLPRLTYWMLGEEVDGAWSYSDQIDADGVMPVVVRSIWRRHLGKVYRGVTCHIALVHPETTIHIRRTTVAKDGVVSVEFINP